MASSRSSWCPIWVTCSKTHHLSTTTPLLQSHNNRNTRTNKPQDVCEIQEGNFKNKLSLFSLFSLPYKTSFQIELRPSKLHWRVGYQNLAIRSGQEKFTHTRDVHILWQVHIPLWGVNRHHGDFLSLSMSLHSKLTITGSWLHCQYWLYCKW